MKSGLEIAQDATLKPIAEIAAAAGVDDGELELYGDHRAKIDLSLLDRLAARPDGRLYSFGAFADSSRRTEANHSDRPAAATPDGSRGSP